MAQLRILKASCQTLVAFSTELTMKDIKTAKIANPQALIVKEETKKVFEFDTTKPHGYTCLSLEGVIIPEVEKTDEKLSYVFDVSKSDTETMKYVCAVVLQHMKTIEKQVAAAVKKVRSVEIPMEEVTSSQGAN